MLMKMEYCQIHGQDSRSLLCKKTPPKGYMWSGRRRPKNSNNNSTRSCVALKRGPGLGKPLQKEKNKNRQSRNRNSTLHKFERELFYWSGWRGIQRHHQECEEKLESYMAAAMPCKRKPRSMSRRDTGALIRTKANASKKIPKTKIELYCGSSGFPKTKNGFCYEEKSWRPHCRQRTKFNVAVQFGAKTYSNASGNENSRCAKAAVDKEWKKLETIPAWQLEKVKNKKEGKKKGTEKLKNKSTLLHWWTSVICRMRSWNDNSRCTEDVLCFEELLWRMTLKLVQYPLNKAHLRRKWRPHK